MAAWRKVKVTRRQSMQRQQLKHLQCLTTEIWTRAGMDMDMDMATATARLLLKLKSCRHTAQAHADSAPQACHLF